MPCNWANNELYVGWPGVRVVIRCVSLRAAEVLSLACSRLTGLLPGCYHAVRALVMALLPQPPPQQTGLWLDQ